MQHMSQNTQVWLCHRSIYRNPDPTLKPFSGLGSRDSSLLLDPRAAYSVNPGDFCCTGHGLSAASEYSFRLKGIS